MPPAGERATSRGDAQALALTEELGAQLRRMKGGGAKIAQFLSMLAPERDRSPGALGTLSQSVQAVPFGRVRKVLEGELDAPVRELFAAFDEDPFATLDHAGTCIDGGSHHFASAFSSPGLTICDMKWIPSTPPWAAVARMSSSGRSCG